MATCSLGTPNIKISSLNFSRNRPGSSPARYGARVWKGRKWQHAALVLSNQLEKNLPVGCGSSSEAESLTSPDTKIPSGLTSKPIPKAYEIERLVSEICDTTSIADFELKLGGFRLYVSRDLARNAKPAASTTAAASISNLATVAPDVNGSASSPSLALSRLAPSTEGVRTLLENAADEGLAILRSPRVGFFRRSRTIKGKRAPPSCKEKQQVKEGQVLCYIEQLGGELPIESDISGEVIKILREDGDPVGYGDALISLLPSFPGIK